MRKLTHKFFSVTLCGVIALGLWWPKPASAVQPNVILIITDDQGYGDLGAHGNTMIETPHLDRLHDESVRFTNFHVDPTCSPTRAALLTGRYSTRSGVWHTVMGRSILGPGEYTLAEAFSDAGYRTGIFGKWHLGDNAPSRPRDQGFDDSFIHKGGGVGQGPDYWGNNYFDDTYFHNGKPVSVNGYCTDVWFNHALDFVKTNQDSPFFAYISTNAPHGPYNVADKYAQPYREKGVPETMARFYGMITNIDENVGRLRKELSELGLAENTLLIFTTDNGSAAGWRVRNNESGSWNGFNAGLRAGKGSVYDGGHRVPLFFHWPNGELGEPRDLHELTAHIDLLPTLAGLCGLDLASARRLDGQTLKPLLRGQPLDVRTLFVHSQRVEHPEKYRNFAVMTKRWRLVNRDQLYDITKDRAQAHNVAQEHPSVVEKLRSAYDDWWKTLQPVFDDYVRIAIGSKAEPVTRLHSHDWHVDSGNTGDVPWSQRAIESGLMTNGFWAVDIAAPSRYSFELSRWPLHLSQPIEANHARIQIGGKTMEKQVDPSDTSVTFTLELEAQQTRLQTWLTTPEDKTRGAYYVNVRRIK